MHGAPGSGTEEALASLACCSELVRFLLRFRLALVEPLLLALAAFALAAAFSLSSASIKFSSSSTERVSCCCSVLGGGAGGSCSPFFLLSSCCRHWPAQCQCMVSAQGRSYAAACMLAGALTRWLRSCNQHAAFADWSLSHS